MLIYSGKCNEGEVLLPDAFQRVRVWCERTGSAADCRPGAGLLKLLVGRLGSARYRF